MFIWAAVGVVDGSGMALASLGLCVAELGRGAKRFRSRATVERGREIPRLSLGTTGRRQRRVSQRLLV